MSSFIILSNILMYHRGKRRPRFRNSEVGTHLEGSMEKLEIGNLNLVNVKTEKLPKEMKLDSLTIESSYIKNKNNLRFFDKVDVKKISVENSDIDSIFDLGLFESDNDNIGELREKSNDHDVK